MKCLHPPSLLIWPVVWSLIRSIFMIDVIARLSNLASIFDQPPYLISFHLWSASVFDRAFENSGSPALLKCELYGRTALVICGAGRSPGYTHNQSQHGSRLSSHFTGSLFLRSQITHNLRIIMYHDCNVMLWCFPGRFRCWSSSRFITWNKTFHYRLVLTIQSESLFNRLKKMSPLL